VFVFCFISEVVAKTTMLSLMMSRMDKVDVVNNLVLARINSL